ncbi:MAG: LEA type 2 family protein [Fodinibius sp.]|nr:LEA type 2 family protein [Fodinibius sp.]
MPNIQITDWSIGDISFSGTNITVQLAFDNPNAFGIDINKLNYQLMINGNNWAEGTALKNSRIKQNGRTELEIPLSLRFSDIGMSGYRILTGSTPFDYRVKGTFELNLLHNMLGSTTFRF